jgi:ketosteroid isomerase-like protein
MDRREALALLDRLHRAQNEFYSGGPPTALRTLLRQDVQWCVAGDNPLSGTYVGVDDVLAYMRRRRRLAGCTLRLIRRDVLVGHSPRVAALTDGIALRDGRVSRWSTVGLYELVDGQVARCWLLPLDAERFDAIWS